MKAEIFEEALAVVSERLAVVAHEAAVALRRISGGNNIYQDAHGRLPSRSHVALRQQFQQAGQDLITILPTVILYFFVKTGDRQCIRLNSRKKTIKKKNFYIKKKKQKTKTHTTTTHTHR